MTAKKLPEGLHIDTLAVRAAVDKSQYGENSEALFLTSSFTQPDSETAARRFSGLEDGYIYSRFTNPTNASMELRLAALEGAEACVSTSSGLRLSGRLSVMMAISPSTLNRTGGASSLMRFLMH